MQMQYHAMQCGCFFDGKQAGRQAGDKLEGGMGGMAILGEAGCLLLLHACPWIGTSTFIPSAFRFNFSVSIFTIAR